MRVLIVGAGIAGPTLAYWLLHLGHEPTLVEHAPELRRGGYVVDFWGAGFDVAERMGIVPELRDRGYEFVDARSVGRDGRRIASFPPSAFVGSDGRYVTIARSDLASTIHAALGGRVETLFGITVEAVDDAGEVVNVTFEDGTVVAVFDVAGYRPRDELTAVMHADVGSQMLRVSLRDDVTMSCATVRHDGDAPPDDPAEHRALLRRRLAGAGWEVPAILASMASARTFYLDRASQIQMPSWTRGRVALAVHSTVIRFLGLPPVSRLVMGRSLRDSVELPAMPVA